MVGGSPPVAPSVGGRGPVFRLVAAIVLVAVIAIAGTAVYVFYLNVPRAPANTPPHDLSIGVSPTTGNETIAFHFTATVHDDQDPDAVIQVRWDWQNDSVWDTGWSTSKNAAHVFGGAGSYLVRVEAEDTGGRTTNATRALAVSETPHLRIGTVLSVTGVLSIFGASQQNAVDMAVAEINAAGGVLGQPVLVFHKDDATSPTLAGPAAASLVTQDNVSVIIGATASGTSLAVLSIAASAHVLELSPSGTSATFSNLSLTQGWFARAVTSDALQGLVAASYVGQNLSLLQAGAIGIDNAYGRGVTSAFVENYSRFGGAITPGSPRIVSEFQTDYTADLVSVLNVNPMPQAVYVAAYPPNGVTLMRNWWAGVTSYPAWKNVRWVFSEGVYDQGSFIDPLVSAGVNVSGFLGTAPALYAGFVPPAYAEWAARYSMRYGSLPQLFGANAYDATYLAALAAQAAGSLAPAAMRSKLAAVTDPPGFLLGPDNWTVALAELAAGHDINYNGASGPVNLNAYGDIPGPYVVWGVDASNRLYVKENYSEGVVVGLSAGLYPAPPAYSDGAFAALAVRPRDRLEREEELRRF